MSFPSSLVALLGNVAAFSLSIDGVSGAEVIRFSGTEGISRLYRFRVEIVAGPIALRDVIGSPARLRIEGIDRSRDVYGDVEEIEYVGPIRDHSRYVIILSPRAVRLKHRRDCRTFQGKTTPEVVVEVLKGAGLQSEEIRQNLIATYEPRDYCVQYRETDFAFVSRLLEEDGIYYFFEHGDGGCVLVLGDYPGAHPALPGAPVWFNPDGELRTREHVTDIRFGESLQPSKVSLRDFNFQKPEDMLDVDAGAAEGLEVYDYPGEFQETGLGAVHRGGTIARMRLEALQAARQWISGASESVRLVPGLHFQLLGHSRPELAEPLLLTEVRHEGDQSQVLGIDVADGTFAYSNTFTCIPAKVPFRPPRLTPRPVVRGLQSATVVGSDREEVETDEQGRVRVHFHWDRRERGEELASCWIRVAQLWAGAGWGAMFIPRIGHEVLVDFLEGDPDRPIITGRVYHEHNPHPYPLPEEKTKSTIKSETSPGGGGFNELRFEDRKGAEEVFFHAQRDLNEVVLNDNSRSVTANQSFSVGGDQSFSITGDRSVSVSEGDESLTVSMGKSTTTIKMDRDVTVQSGNSSLTVDTGTRTVTVEQAIQETSRSASIGLTACTSIDLRAETTTLTATAKGNVTIASDEGSLTASALGTVSITSEAAELTAIACESVWIESTGSTLGIQSAGQATLGSSELIVLDAPSGVFVQGGTTANVSAGKVVISAGEEITLQVGSSALTINSTGITVSGPKITSSAIGLHEISGALIKIN